MQLAFRDQVNPIIRPERVMWGGSGLFHLIISRLDLELEYKLAQQPSLVDFQGVTDIFFAHPNGKAPADAFGQVRSIVFSRLSGMSM